MDWLDYFYPKIVFLYINIKIEDRFYKKLGLDKNISNYEFLRQLCLEGVKEKNIKELSNKDEYYDR